VKDPSGKAPAGLKNNIQTTISTPIVNAWTRLRLPRCGWRLDDSSIFFFRYKPPLASSRTIYSPALIPEAGTAAADGSSVSARSNVAMAEKFVIVSP
jgi:hypothetical protein